MTLSRDLIIMKINNELNPSVSIDLNGNLIELVDLFDQAQRFLLANIYISEQEVVKLQLILEELYTNSVNHGFSCILEPKISITLSLNDHYLEIIYRDNGLAFDPFQKQDPNLVLSVEDRPIGGLGIFLVKSLVDHFEYSYDGTFNQIIIKTQV